MKNGKAALAVTVVMVFACSACYNNSIRTLSGGYDGSGFNSKNITVSGQANGRTLCALASEV